MGSAPSARRRSTSSSIVRAGRTSRWTRFFTTFGSGTRLEVDPDAGPTRRIGEVGRVGFGIVVVRLEPEDLRPERGDPDGVRAVERQGVRLQAHAYAEDPTSVRTSSKMRSASRA